MARHGKRYRNMVGKFDREKLHSINEAVTFLKENASKKFNETVEVHFNLGVDPRKADQNIRGTVVLPHGLGKTVRVLVLAEGEKVKEAEEAGADYAGSDEYVNKIANDNWFDFDVAIATPDAMRKVGRIGKLLGPRGLMPNPKTGTVTFDIAQAVKEFKAGKVEYRVDKTGNIHVPVGKCSFEVDKLAENIQELVDAVVRAKPASAKGTYIKNFVITSTMGAGLKIDLSSIAAAKV